MTIFRTTNGLADINLGLDEDFILADGVQIYADTTSVITTQTSSQVILGANSAVIGLTTNSINDAIAFEGTGSSSLTIAEGALVSAYADAVDSVQNSTEVLNYGVISARQTGVNLSGSVTEIKNFGTITGSGSIGVRVYDSGNIVNHGEIHGGIWGAVLRDGDGGIVNTGTITGETATYLGNNGIGLEHRLLNSGTISGENHGVYVIGAGATIVNSGTIMAVSGYTITIASVPDSDTTNFINSGIVSSGGLAYTGGVGFDRITNTGEITGVIQLNGNDDYYEGKGGIATGVILGGSGDDTLRGGDGDEEMDGGDGVDIVNGRGGDDDLAGGAGADFVRGGAGDDTVGGSGGADMVLGNRGDDVVNGAAGNDTLNGGQDDDILTGGARFDTFVFGIDHGNDVITDFVDGDDRIDLGAFGLRKADFGAVVAPALSDAGSGATFLDFSLMGHEGSVLIEGLAFADADVNDFLF